MVSRSRVAGVLHALGRVVGAAARQPALRLALQLALPLALTGAAGEALAQNGSSHAGIESNAIEMMLGEQKVLPAQGVKSYSEGVRGVVDVRLTGDASKFVIIGTGKGTTTLLLIMVDGSERLYSIVVRDPRDTGEPKLVAENPLAVAALASIRLDLYFVQVNRNHNFELGMSVNNQLGSGNFSAAYSIPSASMISKSGVVGVQFLPTLEALQVRGWAKVSRHVALITTNGTQADFDTGGEFNTPSSQGLVAGVVSIKYGTKLGVMPRYDDSTGRIEMTVDAEVSDLTPGLPLPGRTKSHVSTIANLALGESLAVAGLVSQNRERERRGIPWLSQIPVIGLLFGKQIDRESDVENMVFIAPSVVQPLKHARARELLGNAFREYDAFAGKSGEGRFFPGTPRELPAAPGGPKH